MHNIYIISVHKNFMPTITLAVPAELKKAMENSKMINWSEVARRAFVEQLKDLVELNNMKKIRKISEISTLDQRGFNKEYQKELLKITKSPHTKIMNFEELDKLMGIK
jgi:hypothetical protein